MRGRLLLNFPHNLYSGYKSWFMEINLSCRSEKCLYLRSTKKCSYRQRDNSSRYYWYEPPRAPLRKGINNSCRWFSYEQKKKCMCVLLCMLLLLEMFVKLLPLVGRHHSTNQPVHHTYNGAWRWLG